MEKRGITKQGIGFIFCWNVLSFMLNYLSKEVFFFTYNEELELMDKAGYPYERQKNKSKIKKCRN